MFRRVNPLPPENDQPTIFQGACLIDALMKLVEALTRLLPSVSEEEGEGPASATVKYEADRQPFEFPHGARFDDSFFSSLPPSSSGLELEASSGKAGEENHKENIVDRKKEEDIDVEFRQGAERREQQSRKIDKSKGTRGRWGTTHNPPPAHIAAAAAAAAATPAAAALPHVEFWDKLR